MLPSERFLLPGRYFGWIATVERGGLTVRIYGHAEVTHDGLHVTFRDGVGGPGPSSIVMGFRRL
jgi:hypothetical protein